MIGNKLALFWLSLLLKPPLAFVQSMTRSRQLGFDSLVKVLSESPLKMEISNLTIFSQNI